LVERPKTWVHLVVLQVVGEEDLVAERLQVALEFHRSVSDQAVAHLNLLHDNTFRTPWLAAKLLSTDKALAKSSTDALVKHLVTTRPGNKTSFEHHVFTHGEVWENSNTFPMQSLQCSCWGNNGQYESIVKLLAPRFFWALGHVLDAERTHALWQWACTLEKKRAMNIMTLKSNILPPALLREQPDLPLA
jgi:hypothetical protein